MNVVSFFALFMLRRLNVSHYAQKENVLYLNPVRCVYTAKNFFCASRLLSWSALSVDTLQKAAILILRYSFLSASVAAVSSFLFNKSAEIASSAFFLHVSIHTDMSIRTKFSSLFGL